MWARDLRLERVHSENVLKTYGYDASAKYVALGELQELSIAHPEIFQPETNSTLASVLLDGTISRQKQGLFLYKRAAETLRSLVVHSRESGVPEGAFVALKEALSTATGLARRAATEALGDLPLKIRGPAIEPETKGLAPSLGWHDILERKGIRISGEPKFWGRSLVAAIGGNGRRLVVKLARRKDSIGSLVQEALWMTHLREKRDSLSIRFHVPEAIRTDGTYAFRLENVPLALPEKLDLHPEHYAIGFLTLDDYFAYPNDYREERRLSMGAFRACMLKNARLVGELASAGIVHSALIPLFHNRVQRQRRTDRGLYEWSRGGRLDRWLDSCRYPNFAATGIRDLEHLMAFRGPSRELYVHIGTHLLSLLLVSGSYFRNKDPRKVGLGRDGKPVDARGLFDEIFLKALIEGIFISYYQGFVGEAFAGQLPFSLSHLTSRMIDEMGVDRHMEEILRGQDQDRMTGKEFADFLVERGYDRKAITGFRKGAQDIIISSGPHLGGFNQRISLPEMLEAVGAMSALCIAGRYRREKVVSYG
jgi:hypothetical protein